MHSKMTPYVRILTVIICLGACGFSVGLLLGSKAVTTFASTFFNVVFFFLSIAVLCLSPYLLRLATRLDEERRFRIAAENAPISLGVNRGEHYSSEQADRRDR